MASCGPGWLRGRPCEETCWQLCATSKRRYGLEGLIEIATNEGIIPQPHAGVSASKPAPRISIHPLGCLLENDNMLPRQNVDRLDPPQGQHRHFFFYLGRAHFMDRFNGDIGVLGAE